MDAINSKCWPRRALTRDFRESRRLFFSLPGLYCAAAHPQGITVSEIIFEGGYKARVITRKESCSNMSAPRATYVGIKYFQRRDISLPTIFSLAEN